MREGTGSGWMQCSEAVVEDWKSYEYGNADTPSGSVVA